MKLVCLCSSWVWDDGFAKLLVSGRLLVFLISAMTTLTLLSQQSNINWSKEPYVNPPVMFQVPGVVLGSCAL